VNHALTRTHRLAHGRSLPGEQEIQHPAPAHVFAAPAVRQDVLICAAGVFEGIGQDGQAVEGAVVVDMARRKSYATLSS
jgi:hypothetical protein